MGYTDEERDADMALEVEHQDLPNGTSVIRLRGKMLLGAPLLPLESLVPELVAGGRKNLVFDLSGVTHIDSTGIGRFIDTYGRLERVGGRMFLAGAKGAVRDCFRITRLDTVFSFYPSVEAACEGLN
jgi:anti-sigma B factor antagonist